MDDKRLEGETGWSALLDQLKAQEGLKSDARLAELLGVTRSFISAVRKKRKNISAELGEQIFARLRIPIVGEHLEIFKPLRMQRDIRRHQPTTVVKEDVFQRANGRCELCLCPAPFFTLQGEPYLELHHIVPVVLEGKSDITNVVALCPNCHRKVELRPSEEDTKILQRRATLLLKN